MKEYMVYRHVTSLALYPVSAIVSLVYCAEEQPSLTTVLLYK